MAEGSGLSLLNNWQNFYMLVGTAAATLTGLMFVVTTLLAGINKNAEALNAGIAAFNTPTVVYFCVVLLLAGVLSAPWRTFISLGFLLGLFGLGMVFYQLIIMRRMGRIAHYQTTLEDWLWYMVFPLLAHILLIASAFMLTRDPALALYVVGLAMIMLLLIGIRNSWDNVTFLAIKRAQPENTDKN